MQDAGCRMQDEVIVSSVVWLFCASRQQKDGAGSKRRYGLQACTSCDGTALKRANGLIGAEKEDRQTD